MGFIFSAAAVAKATVLIRSEMKPKISAFCVTEPLWITRWHLCFVLWKMLLPLPIAIFCLTRGECFPEDEGEHSAWPWGFSELCRSPESQWPRARSWIIWKQWPFSLQHSRCSALGNRLVFYSFGTQEEEGTLDTSSSTSLISEMGEKVRKGKGLSRGHIAREVSRTSFLAWKSEYTYSILLLW